MNITGTTLTGCTIGLYYDTNIFTGVTVTFALTANTGFYDFLNPTPETFTLTSNTAFYDFFNPVSASFTLTKGPEQ